MTAINFMFNADTVVIAMDTLSISVQDRTPYKFASKIFPLPHLRSVMCGTGNLDLILEWYTTIQKNVISYDIDYFSQLTSDTLKSLNAKYPPEATTTIYQFGYSHKHDKFRGFVYRSTNDFKSEEYEYCTAYKPQVDFDFFGEAEKHGLDEAFIKLITMQKIEDDACIDRVGIGGEIHRFIMTKDSNKLDIIHRFPDHEEQYGQMVDKLNK
jgi:hypothetical protein